MTQPNPIRTRKAAAARRRRSPWPALAVGTVLVVGAYAGATAVFSGRAQGITQDFGRGLAAQVNASGVATLRETGYSKGLTDSTQTMTLTLRETESDAGKPLTPLITNHIRHGPLPGFQGVGQATVDTTFRFADAEKQAEYDKLFPGEKPAIHTLVGLAGGTESLVSVPQGQTTRDGQTVAWKALAGTVQVSGGRVSTDMSWPGLTSDGPEGRADFSGFRLAGTTQRSGPDDRLGTGDMAFTADRLSFSGEGQEVSLGGLKVASQTSQSGNFYDSVLKYGAAEVKVAGADLKNVQLDLGLRHLDRAALQRLLAVSREAQSGARAGDTSGPTEAQTKELEAAGLALLRGNPKLTLDRLSVTQPSGEIVLTGEASAQRLAEQLAQGGAEDLRMMAAVPTALLGLLDVRLEGRAPRQALEELAALGGDAGDLTGNIQALVGGGYVREEGGQLSTELNLTDGRLTLNGQALGE